MARQGAGGATKPKQFLTKDELLAKLRRREKQLDLPESVGGGRFRIQGLAVDDFKAVRSMGDEETESSDLFKRVCMLGIIEPELTVDDLEALGESDLGAVTAIANEIMRLSGMLADDVEGGADGFFGATRNGKGSSSTA